MEYHWATIRAERCVALPHQCLILRAIRSPVCGDFILPELRSHTPWCLKCRSGLCDVLGRRPLDDHFVRNSPPCLPEVKLVGYSPSRPPEVDLVGYSPSRLPEVD